MIARNLKILQRSTHYPPCKVEMKTTTSFSSSVVSSWPLSSQSQSFTRARTPGLTVSPFINISGLSLIKLVRIQDSKSFIVNFSTPFCSSTLTLWIFTELQRSSNPPPNSTVSFISENLQSFETFFLLPPFFFLLFFLLLSSSQPRETYRRIKKVSTRQQWRQR